MLGCRDANSNELLSAYFRAHRRGRFGLCADPDFRAVYQTHGLGGFSRIPVVSGEPALAAPILGRWDRGRRADTAGADRHTSALERLIDRFRRADFGADAEVAEIRGGTRYQVAVGSAAIPVDGPDQCLAGSARGYFGRANSIRAGLRH